MEIKGISASLGIAIGQVHVLTHDVYAPDLTSIQRRDVEEEINRFNQGKSLSVGQLETLYQNVFEKVGQEEAELFQGQIEIVVDEDLTNEILGKIQNQLMNAEAAVSIAFEEAISEVESLDDPYLRARADDLRDIGRRFVRNIADRACVDNFSEIEAAVIIIGHDITPSDVAQMDMTKVIGIVSETGSVTSHVSIMAQTLAVPAVVGACQITNRVSDGDIVVLDGQEGVVVVNPSPSVLSMYQNKQRLYEQENQRLSQIVDLPAVTLDGKQIELLANIGTDRDIEAAIRFGAQGVGLYRTEYLYMDRECVPTEDAQFAAYRKVLERMQNHKVIIRTADLGGDKAIPYIDFPGEENPFLGWRGVRIYKDYPAIIKTQLRAILRASIYGQVKILFPMIISVEEVQQLKGVLSEVKCKLTEENIPFDQNIEIGVMIETPAAVMISEALAKEVDFFSIGTNDLTQYTLAVDRGNSRIANQYNELHPSVIRLIKHVVDHAHANGKYVGMCGELAGDVQATELLIGLGLDELSMSASRIPKVKEVVINSMYDIALNLAEQVCRVGSSSQVFNLLSGIKISAGIKNTKSNPQKESIL